MLTMLLLVPVDNHQAIENPGILFQARKWCRLDMAAIWPCTQHIPSRQPGFKTSLHFVTFIINH